MNDEKKSKEQLIHELTELREQVATPQASESQGKQIHDLSERLDKLNCLYEISGLFDTPGLSLSQILVRYCTDVMSGSVQE